MTKIYVLTKGGQLLTWVVTEEYSEVHLAMGGEPDAYYNQRTSRSAYIELTTEKENHKISFQKRYVFLYEEV